jgi:hypothetical protein
MRRRSPKQLLSGGTVHLSLGATLIGPERLPPEAYLPETAARLMDA